MDRRKFLVGAAAVAGLAATPRPVRARQAGKEAKLARLAIMSLSFGSILKGANQPDSPARVLDIMDIGQMYADRFGIHNVEMQHAYMPSTEEAWLKAFRARLAETKSTVSNINCEFGAAMTMSSDTLVGRLQAIDLTKRWVDHAVTLGCTRLMLNQGQLTEENKQIAIAAFKVMGDYAKSKGVMVSLEPRGAGGGGRQGAAGARGAGAAPAPAAAPPPPAPTTAPAGPPPYILLTEVIKGSGGYANVDIANFGDQDVQQAGIRAMMPFTNGNTHVRLNVARYDVPAALKIMREEFKYTGIYSIESGVGAGPDPYANIQAIHDVVMEHM